MSEIDERIKQIREREAKATKGPWRAAESKDGYFVEDIPFLLQALAQKEAEYSALRTENENIGAVLRGKEAEVKRLKEVMTCGVLKDHDGCQIHTEEMVTKIEAKLYKAEAQLEEARKAVDYLKEIKHEIRPYYIQTRIYELLDEQAAIKQETPADNPGER